MFYSYRLLFYVVVVVLLTALFAVARSCKRHRNFGKLRAGARRADAAPRAAVILDGDLKFFVLEGHKQLHGVGRYWARRESRQRGIAAVVFEPLELLVVIHIGKTLRYASPRS